MRGDVVTYLIGQLGTILQGVDRSTGEAILATVQRIDPGSANRERCARRVRVNESDDAGYNPRCERGLAQSRPAGWQHLRFPREVHFTSGTHTKVYDIPFLKSDITGMMQTRLALSEFGRMIAFRDAGRKALRRMIRIVDHLLLSETAAAYKELVLDVFVGKGPKVAAIRATLLRLAPGDWRVAGEWAWLREGQETVDQVLELLYEGVVPIFWGHAPFEFPRARWTGCEKTFQDLGLPIVIHNVEHETMMEFRADMGEPRVVQDDALGGAAMPALLDDGAAAAAGPGVGGLAAGAAEGGAPHEPLGGDDVANAVDANGVVDWKQLAAKGKEHRTKSLAWLQTKPGTGNNYIELHTTLVLLLVLFGGSQFEI